MLFVLGDSQDPVVDWISASLNVVPSSGPARASVTVADGQSAVTRIENTETDFSCLYRAARNPRRATTADEAYFDAEWFCRDMTLLQLARGSNIRPLAGRLLSDTEIWHRLPKSMRVLEALYLDTFLPKEASCTEQWQDLFTGETGTGDWSKAISGLVRVFEDASLEYQFFLTCRQKAFELSWGSRASPREHDVAQNAATELCALGVLHAGVVLTKTASGPRVAKVVQFPPLDWYDAVNSTEDFALGLRSVFVVS